jgi:hypothetical protein
MPLITTAIQNLLNGVSQQADSQRFPSQAEEQINGISSPVEGLIKRYPTEHITKVFPTAPTDIFSQALNRDSSERYMVTVRNSEWKTFEADNTTNTFESTAHGFVAGEAVRLYTASGTLPTEVSATLRYYIVDPVPSANTFQLSLTSGGSAIAITGDGSGTLNVGRDPISVIDVLTGTEKAVTSTDSVNYLVATTPSTTFKATTIADYTFIVDTDQTVAMDSTTSTDHDASSSAVRAYVYIRQGDYGTDYKIELNGTTYTKTTEDGADAPDRLLIDTEYIAEQLVVALGTPTNFETPVVKGSTIEIRRTDGADFEITTHDGLGDAAMKAVKDTVDFFTELPLYCRDGRIVKVRGDVETKSDDYYVKFTAKSPSNEPFGEGTWAETIGHGLEYILDAATMPHVLIRESSGAFTFEKATWDNKLAGDLTTNPNPSFVAAKIANIVLFRDRLGLLSGENISMSETGEYFNFFRTTVTQLLGTDPVDVRASHNKVSFLKDALPYNRNLILFSDRTQFMLTGGDVLSPASVSISQETEFEVDNTASPLVSGRNIYFPFTRGNYGGLMEYFISPETEQMDGADTSSHIPKYLDGTITKLTDSSTDPTIAVLTDGYTNGFFVYKYMFNGRQKIQSAWSKFSLDSGATVKNLDFIGKTLYLVVSRTDGVYLESMSFKTDYKDTDAAYTTRLDRRVSEAECTFAYDSGTQQTTITVPYTVYGTMEVCSRAHSGTSTKEGTKYKVISQTGTSVVVDGDVSSAKLWVGEQYSFTYTLSKPYLKESSETGGKSNVASGRFQVRNGTISFDDTVAFKVNVAIDGRNQRTHTFDHRLAGTSSFTLGGPQETKDGTFKFPIRSKGDRVNIELVNDTPFPSCFLTVEYEAMYYNRARRVQ